MSEWMDLDPQQRRADIERVLAARHKQASLWRYALTMLRYRMWWAWHIHIRRRRCQAPGCQQRAHVHYGGFLGECEWTCTRQACAAWVEQRWASGMRIGPEVER